MLLTARLLLLILVVFVLPVALHAAYWLARSDLATSYARADWSSASLLRPAGDSPEAMVRIYAARTGRWRGIFAHHSWIVIKERGATRYTRFDKVGWGSPVRVNGWAADGRWFGNDPELVVAVDGKAAEALIPRIRAAVESYPHSRAGDYRAWPGPNSNTFVAHVIGQIPELGAALPSTAIGKDFRPLGDVAGLAPSRTGIRLSLGGYAGLTLAWVEGVELNFLGAVAGLDLRRPALKVPGWGRFGLPATVADEDDVPPRMLREAGLR